MNLSPKVIIGGVLSLIAIVAIFSSFTTNDSDKISVLQTPWGRMSVQSDAGPFLTYWGNVIVYNKVEALKLNKVPVRFSDTNQGLAMGISRFRLPTDKRNMLKINEEFGSSSSLRDHLLHPVTEETVKASARLMTVENHYGGGAGQLSNDFEEQLINGIYITEQFFVTGTDTDTDGDDSRNISKLARTETIKVQNPDGSFKRKTSALAEYSITVVQASIVDVDYADNVDKRLVRQKDSAAKQSLAREELKRAQQEELTAEAEGRKQVAITRAEESVKTERLTAEANREKDVALVNAAQRREVAEQDLIRQDAVLAIQNLEAKGLRVLAAARAVANKSNSGVDPKYVFDKNLEAEVAKSAQWAEAYSKRSVPSFQMSGSSGSTSTGDELLALMKVSQALNITKQMASSKP